ncbi:hypothetical protein IP92_01913 [Pseudoduganella flava]|uniref:Uncharacterized protein n=1 Tax=Pseudoduganella flava TaxID=871742 RepID=A0A562PVP9_9BURK|nr:hypothetical protein [Pseudoduganella flava]QGZ39622.1 hypothetical protein GO485_11570 [Pseudoduganella flava]TWI48521.1 hypothetical protein IP92_01913 [Pseudoduganella flava]
MSDLMQPVCRLIGEHREDILRKMDGKAGQWTVAALQNEQAIDTLAGICYELLPGLVRLAVKEPAFRTFVRNNRERIVAQLMPPQQAAGG